LGPSTAVFFVEQFLFPSYLAGKKIQENVPAACGCWNQRKSFFFVKVSRTCHIPGDFSFYQSFQNLPRFWNLYYFSKVLEPATFFGTYTFFKYF
jgi:hypothetical protein